jgi:hypothetical protein
MIFILNVDKGLYACSLAKSIPEYGYYKGIISCLIPEVVLVLRGMLTVTLTGRAWLQNAAAASVRPKQCEAVSSEGKNILISSITLFTDNPRPPFI